MNVRNVLKIVKDNENIKQLSVTLH